MLYNCCRRYGSTIRGPRCLPRKPSDVETSIIIKMVTLSFRIFKETWLASIPYMNFNIMIKHRLFHILASPIVCIKYIRMYKIHNKLIVWHMNPSSPAKSRKGMSLMFAVLINIVNNYITTFFIRIPYRITNTIYISSYVRILLRQRIHPIPQTRPRVHVSRAIIIQPCLLVELLAVELIRHLLTAAVFVNEQFAIR